MSFGVPACSDDGTDLATHRGVGVTKRRENELTCTELTCTANDAAGSLEKAAQEQGGGGWRSVQTLSACTDGPFQGRLASAFQRFYLYPQVVEGPAATSFCNS
jgi:hypothetical protein